MSATAWISVLVCNAYDDGTEIITTDTATVPAPQGGDAWSDWWQEHVFPLTGTGHPQGNAVHEVWITDSDVPDLVGLTHEFG
ncbi:hypothetical protein ACWD2L_00615 [Streptomyces sp. NPDC002754]